jgi:hypothetical protein
VTVWTILTILIPTPAAGEELARRLLKVRRLSRRCRGTAFTFTLTLSFTFAFAGAFAFVVAVAFAFAFAFAFTFAFAFSFSFALAAWPFELRSGSSRHGANEHGAKALLTTTLIIVATRSLNELFDDTKQIVVTPIWMV